MDLPQREFSCNICAQSFKWKHHLKRHTNEKRCPIFKTQDALGTPSAEFLENKTIAELKTIIQSMMIMEKKFGDKIDCLQMQVNKLSTIVCKQPNNVTVSNNIVNNNNLTFVINNYGNEDMTHITHADKLKWASDPKTGVLAYVQKKHFDPEKPANHNLKIASVKREELSVHVDGGWKKEPAKPFLHKVLGTLVYDLTNAIDWENCTEDAEQYIEQVSDDTNCKQGKESVNDIYFLVQNACNHDSLLQSKK